METALSKNRSLPREDLARIAVLRTAAEKRTALRRLLGDPRFSYRSLRMVESDILGVGLRLPMSVGDPPLDGILREVTRLSKRGDERASCIQVARLFYQLVRAERFRATPEDFLPLQLGLGVPVSFCAQAVLGGGEASVVVATNYRRTPLAGAGLRFALSVMHEQSRALNPDLRSARLGMVQFPQPRKAERYGTITYGDGADLFSYDSLVSMTGETLDIWTEVQEAAAEEARKTGTDDGWWGEG